MLREIIRHKSFRPCSNEILLIAFSLENQNEFEIFRDYPFVTDYEYDLEPGMTNLGKGDLILTKGKNSYLIVEAKYLCNENGKTARRKRSSKRKKVNEQAERYLRLFHEKCPDTKAESFVLTNDLFSDNEELQTAFDTFKTKRKEYWKKRERKLYPVKINSR